MTLGEEGNFGLALRGYIPPDVRCMQTVPNQHPVSADCQTLIENMDTGKTPLRFGARGTPGVQEILPKILSRCLLSFVFVLELTFRTFTCLPFDWHSLPLTFLPVLSFYLVAFSKYRDDFSFDSRSQRTCGIC